MLTEEQREAIYRLALQQQYADLSDYLNSITVPEGWQVVPTTVLQSALRALEESVDLVQSEYDTNWRQGMPTRKGQLDAMLLELGNHKDAIELLKKFVGSGTVPEGWKLVPVEPTQKMLEAAIYDTSQDFGPDDYEATIGNYQAMLAAAPKPGEND